MSVSYTAQVFWGIKLSNEDLVTKVPNPKFDPNNPFDSRTGRRIPLFLEDCPSEEELAEKFKLETASSDGNVFFGSSVCDAVDLNYDCGDSELEPPTEKEQEEIYANIQKLLASLKIKPVKGKLFLITYAG